MKIKSFLLLVLVVVQSACSPTGTQPPIQILATPPTQIITPTIIATSTPVIQKVYLMDLEPESVSVGYWALGKGKFPASDSGMDSGQVIRSHGISYSQGLFAHAPPYSYLNWMEYIQPLSRIFSLKTQLVEMVPTFPSVLIMMKFIVRRMSLRARSRIMLN